MKELILRNSPDIADAFEMRECDSVNGSDHYEVFCENDKIVICGNCKISQAMGYYAYLRNIAESISPAAATGASTSQALPFSTVKFKRP